MPEEMPQTVLEQWVATHLGDVFTPDADTGRYVVAKLVAYRGDRDETAYAVVDTLEQAQLEVEDHLFGHPPREDYTRTCRVFDSNLKKELLFEEVQKIEWKL